MNTKGESSFDGVWHQNDSPGGNVFPASIDRKPKNGVSQSFYLVFSEKTASIGIQKYTE